MSLVELAPDSDFEAELTAQQLFKMWEPEGGYDYTMICQGHKVIARLLTKFNKAFAKISPRTIPPLDLPLCIGFPSPIFNSPYRCDSLDPVLSTPPPMLLNPHDLQSIATGHPAELSGTVNTLNSNSKGYGPGFKRTAVNAGVSVSNCVPGHSLGACASIDANTMTGSSASGTTKQPHHPSNSVYEPQPIIACSPYMPLKRDYVFYGNVNWDLQWGLPLSHEKQQQ
ncbi:hypothetical protein F5146DRAFT_1008132 [Armillaria mellea]|nr:hypothetical protein F5146DRAFT_1008132 [Armillaria mellea]